MNRVNLRSGWYLFVFIFSIFYFPARISAKEFSETSFLIVGFESSGMHNKDFWEFLQSDKYSGIEVDATEKKGQVTLAGAQQNMDILMSQLKILMKNDSSRIIPVFMNYEGDISVLDSIIGHSEIASRIFSLPRGEAWPRTEYLVQANRRIIFFVSGNFESSGQILHRTSDYVFQVSASASSGSSPVSKTNLELLMINDLEKLPINNSSESNIRNLVPDYINFLLENWTKYGKRPNFIFVGDDFLKFDFIISQLNSFIWINGTIKDGGKTLEKIYWKNSEVAVTGGRFSFPYRGGDELTLTPFVAGYRLTPEQVIVTGEMEVPENYNIMANSLKLSEGLTGSFRFDDSIQNVLFPSKVFSGEGYSFSEDIERGTVLRLPERASVNLGPPDSYGLRNSSFSVSCFVKFSEILEFGDNAVLGNYENEFRRGLHLILRSGHPYFGLWANDYISEKQLEANVWYHLVWRYIIETGEQAIFLNGKNIGSSGGHLPFSGTGDIHIGSALSKGASLRGYIDDLHFWKRPLGEEEINRLALDEEIMLTKEDTRSGFLQAFWIKIGLAVLVILFLGGIFIFFFRKKGLMKKDSAVPLPGGNDANQVNLFGGFSAVDEEGRDISQLFTPKVKELFLFVLFGTLRSGSGKAIVEINEHLWPGLSVKKVTNNRAVTLNKLRKILCHIRGVDIVSQNGFLFITMEKPFFCDYAEAYKLCQVAGGMDKQQLETFFQLVKKGSFLNGNNWPWLDGIRGVTGNQVIDNLLKLASIYKKEKKLLRVDALAKRILEYDDLNEEAIYLQIRTLQKSGNLYQAKFRFDSFRSKYRENLGEEYSLSFEEFTRIFSEQL